jgi:drug/metabolite transporter (DMT)-like permease
MKVPFPAARTSPDLRRGILWMLATTIFFTSLDTTAKYLTHSYPVAEIVWGRYLFHALFGMMWAGRRLPDVLLHARFGIQALRGFFLVVTTAIYFLAIRTVPLADAASISFMAPILVTALSVPLLGEPVGVRRWIGVVVGFVGTVIIVRPGSGVMQAATLLVLASAAINALYQITTRVLNRTDLPMTTNVYSALIGTALAALALPFGWITPDLEGWSLLALAGLFGVVGHYCMIKSLAAAPVAAVVPFSYVGLLWATIYGVAIFGDVPDGWTVLGAAVIAGSGLYIFYRGEAKKRDAARS